jgi:integrase
MNAENLVIDLFKILSSHGIVLDMDTLLKSQNSDDSQNLKLVGKKHGFKLKKVNDHYEVRYKDGDSWLSTKKIIYTDNEREAVNFAISEKQNIILEYKGKKASREQKKDCIQLYKMLSGYYTENSIYLQKDSNDNKDSIAPSHIRILKNITEKYLIPFLKEKKVKCFDDITKSVYADYKIHLQSKNYTSGYVNQILSAFNRILKHAERYDMIMKLPYSRGTGLVKKSEEEQERNKGDCLPIEKMLNIIPFCYHLLINRVLKSTEVLLLMALGLTTGLRDKEMANIKISDIKFVSKKNMYLLFVNNKKNERFLSEKSEKYRKIPLHPVVVDLITRHIKKTGRGNDDFLFGKNKNKTEVQKLSYVFSVNAILYLLIAFKIREKIQETASIREAIDIIKSYRGILNSQEKMKEIRDYAQNNNFHFYSFRHTIVTLMNIEKIHPDFNDYFTGHKPIAKMRDNYTHINTVDNGLFCEEYAMPYLDMINKYFFPVKKTKGEMEILRKEALKKFLANREKSIEPNKNINIFESI